MLWKYFILSKAQNIIPNVQKNPPKIINSLAFGWIKLNKKLISKIISQPIAKYNKRDTNSYFPVKNNFFKVPIMDKVRTVTNILMPEQSYRVIRQTGAYEPKMR